MDGDDRIWVVAPACNQAGHLRPLFCAVARHMQGSGRDWRFLVVDDGSDDDSPAVLRALAAEDSRVRAVRLSRSFGFEAALAAGLAHADGAAAIVLDAALDHPAETIPALLAAWRDGAKVVRGALSRPAAERIMGTRRGREPDPFALGLLDRQVLAALASMPPSPCALSETLDWLGYRPTILACPSVRRRAADVAAASTAAPARSPRTRKRWPAWPTVVAALGVALSLLAAAVWIAVLCGVGAMGPELASWAAAAGAVVFLGGIQWTGVGLVCRHLRRQRDAVPDRPRWVAVESIGFDRPRARPQPEPSILRFSSASRIRHSRRATRDKVSHS